jgi:HAD superfamily hydrolase (TIGR01509 family)
MGLMKRANHWGLVIFDCDSVLVDSEPIASRVLAELLTEIGFPFSMEQSIEHFTGLSLTTVLAKVEALWGRPLPADFRSRLVERDETAFRAELQPIAGVAAAVEALKVPACVASSGTPRKIRTNLGTTGLLHLFDPHLFSAEMVARGKPAPDLFLHAAHSMGVAPEACVVVEDSVAGILAARAAGMSPIGFAGGGHAGRGYGAMLASAGAAVVIERMADLPPLLAG